jgi:hypothetical protein
LNPLNTLTGRLVLVTVVAVLISYAAAFVIYFNERGAALRRAAETGVIERVAYTAERLRAASLEQRPLLADGIRDFSIRYHVDTQPIVSENGPGAGGRIARAVAIQLDDADVFARARTVEGPPRRWRRERGDFDGSIAERGDRRPRDDAPMVQSTEVLIAVDLGGGSWLNARASSAGQRISGRACIANRGRHRRRLGLAPNWTPPRRSRHCRASAGFRSNAGRGSG